MVSITKQNILNKEDFKTSITKHLRALSENSNLNVHFPVINLEAINDSKFDEKLDILNFNLPDDVSKNNLITCRAEADFQALKIKYSNKKVFNKFLSDDTSLNFFLQILEDIRVQAIGSHYFEGIKNNLTNRFNQIYSENESGILSIIKPVFENLINQKQVNLPDNLLTEIEALKNSINNQSAYLTVAQNLFNIITFKTQIKPNEGGLEGISNNNKLDEENLQKQQESQTIENHNNQNLKLQETQQNAQEKPSKTIEIEDEVKKKQQEEEENENSENHLVDEKNYVGFKYKIFTDRYDEVAHAHNLSTTLELKKLRQDLEPTVKKVENVIGKLARSIYIKLMAKHKKSFEYGYEEGLIDTKKLSQIIIDPNYPSLYKKEVEKKFKDTVLTILLDNSGSMRGRFIKIAAATAEILTRTLESCGIKVEILGYTTKSWRGGNARKDWQNLGSPQNPGRLNDLLHIVYKDANTPWRKARLNLSLMLKEGILKENIDGEAIMWANSRLLHRLEQRKIIMVISDGAPVDDSTLSANNQNFLDIHLKETVKAIEKAGNIELVAVGIGHDVKRYYQNSITINNIDELGKVMLTKLAEIF